MNNRQLEIFSHENGGRNGCSRATTKLTIYLLGKLMKLLHQWVSRYMVFLNSSLQMFADPGSLGTRERWEIKAFLDRIIRAMVLCSSTLRDWKARRTHAPTLMEVFSPRFRARCLVARQSVHANEINASS
jgi:hypothetical protein